MDPLLSHLWQRWRDRGLPDLVVAVSGGADSVALARLLAELREGPARSRGPGLVLAHLDHALRPESSREAESVRALGEELSLPVRIRRLSSGEVAWLRDEPGAVAPEGLEPAPSSGHAGLQARARWIRRSQLEVWCREESAGAVALAHHRDDQAETVLLQLLRGTRPVGMAESGPGSFWRPLLGVPGRSLRDWLQERGHSWREDPSNQDDRFLRVALRRKVLPLLEELRPGAGATLARQGARLAAQDQALGDLSGRLAPAPHPGGGTWFRDEDLEGWPRAMVERSLARALEDLRVLPATRGEREAASALLGASVGAGRNFGDGTRLLRVRGGLRLLPASAPSGDPLAPFRGEGRPVAPGQRMEIPGFGANPDPGPEIRVTRRPGGDLPEAAPLFLRLPRGGERFRPRSLGGRSKRLARYLRDRGLDREARGRVVLLTAGERILWVAGQEPAAECEFESLGLSLEIMW